MAMAGDRDSGILKVYCVCGVVWCMHVCVCVAAYKPMRVSWGCKCVELGSPDWAAFETPIIMMTDHPRSYNSNTAAHHHSSSLSHTHSMAMASPIPTTDPTMSTTSTTGSIAMDDRRRQALSDYQRLLVECREKEAKLKELRMSIRDFEAQYARSEHDIQALQTVGQLIGEVLKELDGTRIYDKNITQCIYTYIYCR